MWLNMQYITTSPPSLFEPMKTYELQGFKLKKGFGSSELEIVIDDTTQVQLSEDQFKMFV